MYDANTHYLLMARRKLSKARPSGSIATDNRAAQRIMPGMPERQESRMDRILKPFRGRSYEGPTEPEVV